MAALAAVRDLREHWVPASAEELFIAAFPRISSHFRPRRHLITARDYRTETTERFRIRKAVTGRPATA
ncbi:hypothetical protein [Streptomyces scopuliridis]|uniref:hypothetical protein n=1 Tax=Streptomyces scopuliridis TaxID=452529 RepID=UPI0036B66848